VQIPLDLIDGEFCRQTNDPLDDPVSLHRVECVFAISQGAAGYRRDRFPEALDEPPAARSSI
jgi:hypothetical protein